MNQLTILAIAFLGGIFLAIQGGFNAQLAAHLKSPLLAAVVAFSASACLGLFYLLCSNTPFPAKSSLETIPFYLWFAGAFFSLLGICLYYYTIPILGLGQMISLGLCGQLLFSVVASHFGWFELPVQVIDGRRIWGVIAMVVGIVLIHSNEML